MLSPITRQSGEPLTNENFWNALEQLHPLAVKDFWDWIDTYKSSLDWDLLFWNFSRPPATRVEFVKLPLAMQAGILLEYIAQTSEKHIAGRIKPFTIEALIEWLPGHFEKLNHDRKANERVP